MLLNLHLLSSQKKGAAFSFVLLAAVALLVVGIFSVTSASYSSLPVFSPSYVQASAVNASLNFTISVGSLTSANVQSVFVTKPDGVSKIQCGADLPSGWSCINNGDTIAQFTSITGVAAGSSTPFKVNITPPATAGNQSFQIATAENTANNLNQNATLVNVTVDAVSPTVTVVNISTSVKVISGSESFNNPVAIFLNNASNGINVVINASDVNGAGVGNVSLVYGNGTTTVLMPDYRTAGQTPFVNNVTLSTNTSYGTNLWNITIPTSGIMNGTTVFFMILANDTVGNGNISNATAGYGYNFTIDAVAPQFVDVQIANQSLNATTAIAINTTKTWGSAVEYILNSSLILNVSALVRDDGGAGTVKVEIMDRTGAFLNMGLLTGANGSTGSTTWALNSSPLNISDLVKGFAGDGLYNLTFRATDNVSNVNSTYNFTVEVDDTPPKGSAATNISVNGVLSSGNVTISTLINGTLLNTSFNITLKTSNNINNETRNVSVYGNKGNIANMSFESGTPSGTSYWNLIVNYNSYINSTLFCDLAVTDGTQCNLRFNFSDVMGRENTSINLTIAVDGLAPNVSILSPVSLTTNYTGLALINVSVNDTVGPIQNVSFRIVNRNNFTVISLTSEGFYNTTTVNITNMTNWIPMSLGTGTNTQFLTNGTWNFTINLTALNFSDGNYTIEINATDSAGRQNTTVNRSSLVFDSTPPQNITLITPATNSFWNVNFTVNLNATEQASGLLNVTVRLENGTHNSPWVGVQQAFPSALSSVTNVGETVRFNITAFNITHIGNGMLDNITLNATNGYFTLRLNVTDTAGNQNTSVTINLTIDTTQPKISFVTPGNMINQSGNFTVNVTVTESNVNTVYVRWENGTITNGNSNNGTFANNPMTQGTATTYNSTFTNFTDGSKPLMLDGNYTIRLNITDKAGNYNDTIFIQLVLDKNAPIVGAAAPLANSIQTGNFLVNMSFNDTSTWNLKISNNLAVNTTNINTTETSPIISPVLFRFENNTFNSSWFNMSLASFDLKDANSNRTNASFTFSSIANGMYNIRFTINDTAGNQNNSLTITNITLDNVAPGVAISIINVSPAVSGGTGVSGTIAFNASITDNLPLNISVTNLTTTQTQAFGVFYRFENSTFNGSWLPMSTPSFNESWVQNNTGREHTAVFNASNITTTLADGDYKIRINVTDRANNQNTAQSVSFTIQNGASSVQAHNITFQGGYVTGSDTNQTSPTFLMNTTANSTCLYSLNTPATYYDDILPQTSSNTMGNNVSKQQITNMGFMPDSATNGYSVYYACKDVSGNFTNTGGKTDLFTFGVDTRNFFNITMGSSGDNKARGDYFATGWNSFELPKTTLLANTGVPTNYNITNVLSSLGNSKLTTANFTTIFAYNGTAWSSYVVGAVTNTFTNFTADTPNSKYYINITVANERLEIN